MKKDDLIAKAIELGILPEDVKKEDVDYNDLQKQVKDAEATPKTSGDANTADNGDDPVNDEASKPVTAQKPKIKNTPIGASKNEEAKTLNKKQATIEALKKQPKRTINIPKEPGESEDAFETVMINGYIMQIKKGVYVEVPEQVAKIIMDSQKQTTEALEKAKKKVSDAERMEFDNSN